MKEEKFLAKSEFDSSACHKIAFIIYLATSIFSIIMMIPLFELDSGLTFGLIILITLFIGGMIHCILYFTAKNNKVILTNYKITGTYSRHLSLNIPIDSISSVSKGAFGSLCITCAGNKYSIIFVGNRDDFCSKLNDLLNKRTQQRIQPSPIIVNQQSNYEEIEKLKKLYDDGIITQEEFEIKKRQLLGL